MYQGTGYPNNLPQYFSTITQNYTATYQAAWGNNKSTLYLGDCGTDYPEVCKIILSLALQVT